MTAGPFESIKLIGLEASNEIKGCLYRKSIRSPLPPNYREMDVAFFRDQFPFWIHAFFQDEQASGTICELLES